MANLEYISYGYRLDSSSVLGASLLRFGVEGIQNTLAWRAPDGTEDYTRITRFGTSDYALHLAYARRFAVPGLTLGGHVKIIYRNVGPFANAFGVGFDVAVNYHRANWGVVLALRDVTTTFNALRGACVGAAGGTAGGTLLPCGPDGARYYGWPPTRVAGRAHPGD